jgi:DNA-directed RNA polymerase specialized sigma24 family protein
VSDPQAFRAIYETHHASICAYFARRAPRDEVEDLAAETFVVAWRKLPRKVEHPLPWLYAVARHVLANHRRKAKRKGAPGLFEITLVRPLAPSDRDRIHADAAAYIDHLDTPVDLQWKDRA